MSSRAVPQGERVLRVDWLPGSDLLRGSCHCGAQADGEEPVAMWEWLLAHPDHPAGGPEGPPAPSAPPGPHRVQRRITVGRRVTVPA